MPGVFARSVIAAVLVLAAVAGCSLLPHATRNEIGDIVDDALKQQEKAGTAQLDFASLIPGKWTQLTIVCRDASQASVDDALGFHWVDSPHVSSPGFLAMLVFSTSTKVEKYFDVGQDYSVDWYFVPCPDPADDLEKSIPISLERDRATVSFDFDDGEDTFPSRWFVGKREFLRLQAASAASSMGRSGSGGTIRSSTFL